MKELRKKRDILEMSYIIRSTASAEFILHFPAHEDFRVLIESTDRRDDLLNLVKLRFAHMNPTTTLKVFGVVIQLFKFLSF
jgi:hypothetical protein